MRTVDEELNDFKDHHRLKSGALACAKCAQWSKGLNLVQSLNFFRLTTCNFRSCNFYSRASSSISPRFFC